MRLSEGVFRLALVSAGVDLGGIVDTQLGRDAIQFPDFRGARFARLRQIRLAVFQPFDAARKRPKKMGF